jgi:sugar lactone lactonase YvrE
MNRRIQVFTPEGEYLAQWDDVRWPDNACMDGEGNIYVAELGSLFLGGQADLSQPPGRITVRDPQGTILAEWGMIDPLGAGRFFAPHDIAVDSQGSLYIGEAAPTYSRGTAPADWPLLRKYMRV